MNARILIVCVAFALAGCQTGTSGGAPSPAAYDPDATAHFCGMAVGEHPGPKGQIWVADEPKPVWFSSVRSTLAFTFLPEEPKDIRAIYVTDMGKAVSWDKPGSGEWIDARKAYFVTGADISGGMGDSELVPFSDPEAAKNFIARHGGRVERFSDIAAQDVLGYASDEKRVSSAR